MRRSLLEIYIAFAGEARHFKGVPHVAPLELLAVFPTLDAAPPRRRAGIAS